MFPSVGAPAARAPSEHYYLLSDALPEDKELRVYLQQVRLVSAWL